MKWIDIIKIINSGNQCQYQEFGFIVFGFQRLKMQFSLEYSTKALILRAEFISTFQLKSAISIEMWE